MDATPKDFPKASFGKLPLLLSRLTYAGFRPGGRAPFVSAKGPKTTDTQASFIGLGQRLWMVWWANSLCSDKPRFFFQGIGPRDWPAGVIHWV
ncbi:MAG: hypothetical protein ACQ9IQ_15305 [Nitrospirales bacterium]